MQNGQTSISIVGHILAPLDFPTAAYLSLFLRHAFFECTIFSWRRCQNVPALGLNSWQEQWLAAAIKAKNAKITATHFWMEKTIWLCQRHCRTYCNQMQRELKLRWQVLFDTESSDKGTPKCNLCSMHLRMRLWIFGPWKSCNGPRTIAIAASPCCCRVTWHGEFAHIISCNVVYNIVFHLFFMFQFVVIASTFWRKQIWSAFRSICVMCECTDVRN